MWLQNKACWSLQQSQLMTEIQELLPYPPFHHKIIYKDIKNAFLCTIQFTEVVEYNDGSKRVVLHE